MPYAYAGGDNCYGRGDYYRGDYYRGDPGILSFIGKAAKAVTGIASTLGIPGAGLANKAVTALQGPQQTGLININQNKMLPPGGLQGPVGTMLPGGFLPGLCNIKGTHANKSGYFKRSGPLTGVYIPKGSVCVRNRRMNWANGRAVSRAERRIKAFLRHATRYIRWAHPGKKGRAVPKFGGKKKK